MRVVLDVNILISALLSRDGAPARAIRAWQDGRFDLIISPLLVAELRRALAYPKIRRHIDAGRADEVVDWLTRSAISVDDPAQVAPVAASDPGDDYLLALAAACDAVLVTGDRHLLGLAAHAPVMAVAEFLVRLDRPEGLTII